MKILESIVYVISKLNIFGGREIAESGAKYKFWVFKILPKPQHYHQALDLLVGYGMFSILAHVI